VSWEKVESAYQDALGEIADGKPADAIADAGTALQEAFVTLRCEGNTLGLLAKSARSKGLLPPHDMLMNETLRKLVDWVSAGRSERSDVHQAREPSVEDAWLTVHIVGAPILRWWAFPELRHGLVKEAPVVPWRLAVHVPPRPQRGPCRSIKAVGPGRSSAS
jgi:hypothetical protein